MKESDKLHSSNEVPILLNQKKAAKVIDKSTKWLERQRWLGEGPLYRKIGGSVRYELSDLLAYINSHPKIGNCGQGGEK